MIYSGNRYLSMNEMKENAQYIRTYLLSRGWTINAICGMLGNMQTESTINPGIWQGLEDSNLSGGFGLVQWTPSTKYTNWCATENLVPADINSNLLRILYEVTNNLQWGNDSQGNPPPYNFSAFTQSEDTPYNLALEFLAHYERPANPNQPTRGNQANYWYEYLTSTPSPDNYPKPGKSKVYLYIKKRRTIIV